MTTVAHISTLAFRAVIVLAVAHQTAHSQASPDVEAAANAWMKRSTITIDYKSAGGQSNVFEVDLKKGLTYFGSSTDYCFGPPAPTKLSFADGELVLDFEFRAGCNAVAYRFHPITGIGRILVMREGTTSWTESASRISLRQ